MISDLTNYAAVHERVGLYDASESTGRVLARGRDALDLLHRMSTNDLRPLIEKKGQAAETVLTNEKGRILDFLTVLCDTNGRVLLVTGKGREQTIASWLEKFTIMEDAAFSSATSDIKQFALYGPVANVLIARYTTADVVSMPQMAVAEIAIGDAKVTLVKAHRIAESGWWFFCDAGQAEHVYQALLADVIDLGGARIDDELLEVLRVEAGIPKYPNELNEKHNPLEASLYTAVSFTKGCYIGQEVIARLDSYDKVQRHIMGMRIAGNPPEVIPALVSAPFDANGSHSFALATAAGEAIGEMTSYVYSPMMNCVVGIGYVRTAYANAGSAIDIRVGEESKFPATLEKLPFEMELA